LLALRLGSLAGRADVHHPEPGLLGEGEGTGVERVGELLVVFGDHPGAAAVGAIERDQVDPEPVGDQGHRAMELRREAAGDAAGPIGESHYSFSFGPGDTSGWLSSSSSGSGTTSSSPVM